MNRSGNGAAPQPRTRKRNAEGPDHEIAIIGAGFSGLGMGAALLRENISDFVIFERADDVGGTWRDNTYPGIGVDIPSFAYQFSYDLKPDWSRFFAKGGEVKSYIDEFTDKFRIRPHIRFNAEVRSRTWDSERHLWRLDVGGDEVTARHVISAIGPFVDPKPHGVPGVERFEGKVIHSARWDHDCDLKGKRVAIVGTGASSVQIVPSIAPEVERLDVYQRTPIWVAPKFDPKIPKRLQRLFARFPVTERIARWWTSRIVEAIIITLPLNYSRLPIVARAIEARLRLYLRRTVKDRETRKKLTPHYGLGCKRPAPSNHYWQAFNRDNVGLVTDAIETVTANGVRTADGSEREVDVLILATGFRMAFDPEVFRRTPVTGRDGFDLATSYQEQRLRAYESISIPRLPNHFMIFGPYGWTGASWHVLVQTAARHIIRVIGEAKRRGATAVEVSEEATDRYHRRILGNLEGSVWTQPSCGLSNSYYFDHHGDVPYLRPTSGREAERSSRSFPLDDYRFERLDRPEREPAEPEEVAA